MCVCVCVAINTTDQISLPIQIASSLLSGLMCVCVCIHRILFSVAIWINQWSNGTKSDMIHNVEMNSTEIPTLEFDLVELFRYGISTQRHYCHVFIQFDYQYYCDYVSVNVSNRVEFFFLLLPEDRHIWMCRWVYIIVSYPNLIPNLKRLSFTHHKVGTRSRSIYKVC